VTSLEIDAVRLELEQLDGNLHRIDPIVRRAIELLAVRLDEQWPDAGVLRQPSGVGPLCIAPGGVDLRSMSDDEVADEIATSLLREVASWLP
jgi:hypothetical protein